MPSRYFTVLLSFFLFACHQPTRYHRSWVYPSKADRVSKYIFQHEHALNADLDIAIDENFRIFPGDRLVFSRTNAWAGYDSSLHNQNSGPYPEVRQLVDVIRSIDTCLQVEYSFYRDTSMQKTITVYKDFASPCLIGIDSIFSGQDSTEHFVLRREKGLVRHQLIPVGPEGLDAHRLRFAVTGSDSVKDIVIFVNPADPSFELTPEIRSQLPMYIFGRYLLTHRVKKVSVQKNSPPGEKLLTITGLARVFNEAN